MKIFGIIILTLLIQPVELAKVKPADNIRMMIPESFTPMSESEIRQRYLAYKSPIAMYSDPSRRVDIGVNKSNTQWRESDIKILQSFYKSNFLNIYDKVDFIKEEIQVINDKKYAVFEFESSVQGGRNSVLKKGPLSRYTYIQYTVHEGEVYIFHMNCDKRISGPWRELAPQVMQTIKIK